MAGTLFSKAMIEFGLNTQNALQQLTSFQQRFANGIGQMKSLLVGFVGFQGLRGAYNTLTDLVDVANKWNLPVEKVSQFTNLFTQFGGSAEEAVASLDKFQEMANQLRFHSSGPLKELSAILRTNLSNKDYMGVIQAIRSQWGQLNANARAEVQRMLGVSSDAMRRMLASSDQEFAAALKNSEKFGKLTAENAEKLFEMRKSLAETKQAMTMAMAPVLEALLPIVNALRDMAMWFNGLSDSSKQFVAWAVIIVPTALKVAGSIMKIVGAFKLLKGLGAVGTAAKAVGAAAGAGISGTVAAGGAIAGTVAGLGYLAYKGYELENKQRNRTDGEKAYLNNLVSQITGINPKVHPNANMSMASPEHSGNMNDWVGKSSPTNNVTQTINIYGIKGAEDIAPALRSVVMQNMSPTQGYGG